MRSKPRLALPSLSFLAMGIGLLLVNEAGTLAAQSEPTTGGRAATARLLQEAYRYDPTIRQRALEQMAADPEVVQLPRVTVTDTKLATLLDQILTARQRAAEANRPSIANGAAVDRVILGRPARVGPQPYRELFEDEAKFRPDGPAIAPVTLFDIKF